MQAISRVPESKPVASLSAVFMFTVFPFLILWICNLIAAGSEVVKSLKLISPTNTSIALTILIVTELDVISVAVLEY